MSLSSAISSSHKLDETARDTWCKMNNYIIWCSYREVIVVTKIATGRSSEAQSIVMY